MGTSFHDVSSSICPPSPSAQCSCVGSHSGGFFSCVGKLVAGTALGGGHALSQHSQQSGPCAAGSPRIGKGCSHSRLIGPTCRCAVSMDMHHDFNAGDVWMDNLSRFQGRALPVFWSNCPSRAAHGDPTHIPRCLYMHRSPSLANTDTSHTRH